MGKILFSKLPKDLKDKYNSIMLEELKFFIQFCKSHHLRYSLAYGSVLGAIRHKGMIPWDDDIDIFMPRSDYERLKTLFKDEKGIMGKYTLLLPRETSCYPEPFAKISDTSTSLLFTKMFPIDYGVFIDIFPLDGASPDLNERERVFKLYNSYIKIYRLTQCKHTFKDLILLLGKGGILHVIAYLFRPFLILGEALLYKRVQRKAMQYPFDSSEYVIQNRDIYGFSKSFFPRHWFDQQIECTFEGIQVSIPKDYDSFLKFLYGDYMQLPPEDKRDDRHTIDYLNLEERVQIKEILKELDDN